MKKTFWLLGIMAASAVILFGMAACSSSSDDGDPALPGTLSIVVQGGGSAVAGCTLEAVYTTSGVETVSPQPMPDPARSTQARPPDYGTPCILNASL